MASLIDRTPRQIANLPPVSPLGFGTWRLVAMSRGAARRCVEAALDAGLNLVDTADVYGLDWGGNAFGSVEALLGDVLADAPGLRNRMVLAGKGGIIPGVPYDSSADYLIRACEASLARLRVETIDLYQIHRPDPLTHPAEVARALDRLRTAGKIREAGVSNYTPAQTQALSAHLPFPLATSQPEYSALHTAPMWDGTFDLCAAVGMTPLLWSPLAGGRLASGTDLAADLAAVLDRLAQREGVDRASIAIGFTLALPLAPVTLVGTMDAARLAAMPRVLDIALDRRDVFDIVQASMGKALP